MNRRDKIHAFADGWLRAYDVFGLLPLPERPDPEEVRQERDERHQAAMERIRKAASVQPWDFEHLPHRPAGSGVTFPTEPDIRYHPEPEPDITIGGLHAALDRVDVTDPANYSDLYTNSVGWHMFLAEQRRLADINLALLVLAVHLRMFGREETNAWLRRSGLVLLADRRGNMQVRQLAHDPGCRDVDELEPDS